jgi:hypothetical protein
LARRKALSDQITTISNIANNNNFI